MRRPLFTLFALGFFAGSSFAGSQALAQSAQDDPGLRANCAGDYLQFCSAYQPGTPELQRCFVGNIRRLTPACQAAMRDFDRRTGYRR